MKISVMPSAEILSCSTHQPGYTSLIYRRGRSYYCRACSMRQVMCHECMVYNVYKAITGNSASGNLQETSVSRNIIAMHGKWPTLDPSLGKCVLGKRQQLPFKVLSRMKNISQKLHSEQLRIEHYSSI